MDLLNNKTYIINYTYYVLNEINSYSNLSTIYGGKRRKSSTSSYRCNFIKVL